MQSKKVACPALRALHVLPRRAKGKCSCTACAHTAACGHVQVHQNKMLIFQLRQQLYKRNRFLDTAVACALFLPSSAVQTNGERHALVSFGADYKMATYLPKRPVGASTAEKAKMNDSIAMKTIQLLRESMP